MAGWLSGNSNSKEYQALHVSEDGAAELAAAGPCESNVGPQDQQADDTEVSTRTCYSFAMHPSPRRRPELRSMRGAGI